MEFINKEYFLLLLLLIPYIYWYIFKRKSIFPSMRLPSISAYKNVKSVRTRLVHLPFILNIIIYSLVVIVLARPQTNGKWGSKQVEAIDIMLAIDVSTSMLAEDLTPNRMEAAKEVASEFIADRTEDNIGLTIFAGEAFTQCPMTSDHIVLQNLLKSIKTNIAANGLIEDGTAMGMGLANAISRLQQSKAKSKIVILLTDGVNNRGEISPMTAAEIAKSYGIRVYTIGVGANKVARYPMIVGGTTQYINIPVELDTKGLTDIATQTNGNFYRATNTKELKQIYKDIDKLEKTRMNVKNFTQHYDAYQPFALCAMILLIIELILNLTVLRRIP